MILGFGNNKKTVKELRKKQGLTAKELAEMLKVDTIDILNYFKQSRLHSRADNQKLLR